MFSQPSNVKKASNKVNLTFNSQKYTHLNRGFPKFPPISSSKQSSPPKVKQKQEIPRKQTNNISINLQEFPFDGLFDRIFENLQFMPIKKRILSKISDKFSIY